MILTQAQRLKFRLLAQGLSISPAAVRALRAEIGDQQLSSADFASTSGLILRLEDNVWVNAPIATFNPNFVDSSSPFVLDREATDFIVYGDGLSSRAWYWLQPAYHGSTDSTGRSLNNFVFTHGDRARLSPMQGCGMVCKFCNIPYEDRYGLKPLKAMVDAVQCALDDPLQPARHLLISGGTPRSQEIDFLKEVYRTILHEFSAVEIDIMMVPIDGLLDVDELSRLGLHQLSINLEVFSREIAHNLMRQKHRQGLDHYLGFIENATRALGEARVRSMLMVGLEPQEQTLLGVRAIIERGGVPVLSPFRPDPATPLRAMAPPTAAELEDTFLRATEIADAAGSKLGPHCAPCTHNTLTLAPESDNGVQGCHFCLTLAPS